MTPGVFVSIDSGNDLSPAGHHAITYNTADTLSIGPLGTVLSDITKSFSIKKMPLNMSSAKCRPVWSVIKQLIKVIFLFQYDHRFHHRGSNSSTMWVQLTSIHFGSILPINLRFKLWMNTEFRAFGPDLANTLIQTNLIKLILHSLECSFPHQSLK